MTECKLRPTVIALSLLNLFVFSELPGQSANKRLRLVSADVLKQETDGSRTVRTLKGNVKFEQGSTTITCDLAIQVFNREPIVLIGHVEIVDERSKLSADTVSFFQESGIQIAEGNVFSATATDTTFSDRMTHFDDENKVVSVGNVSIVNPGDGTKLLADYAEYWRDKKYGKIWGDPIWFKYDSVGVETMRITGDTMEVFELGKRILVINHVKISQNKTQAECNRLEYFRGEGRALLTESASVLQSNQEIIGDSLELFFQDSQLQRALVNGNARAISDADPNAREGRWVNKLTGERMTFYFRDEELYRVVVQEQATSEYHIIEGDQYKGSNEVSGDEIEVLLAHGQAQRVTVASSPDLSVGKYAPPRR